MCSRGIFGSFHSSSAHTGNSAMITYTTSLHRDPTTETIICRHMEHSQKHLPVQEWTHWSVQTQASADQCCHYGSSTGQRCHSLRPQEVRLHRSTAAVSTKCSSDWIGDKKLSLSKIECMGYRVSYLVKEVQVFRGESCSLPTVVVKDGDHSWSKVLKSGVHSKDAFEPCSIAK